MSGMLNRVTLMGHLGADPKFRCLPSGKPVCDFRVGVNELGPKLPDGSRGPGHVTWVSCTAWDRLAEIVNQFCRKGSSVYVEGKIQNSSYTDKDGIIRYATKMVALGVQMLDKRADAKAQPNAAPPIDDAGDAMVPPPTNGASSFQQDEDIPF